MSDAAKLAAELEAKLGHQRRGWADHSCRPRRCPVCTERARERDEQARRERRAGKTFGPAPEGVDPFRGLR